MIELQPIGEGDDRHNHAHGSSDLSLSLNAETPALSRAEVSGTKSCGGLLDEFPENWIPLEGPFPLARVMAPCQRAG